MDLYIFIFLSGSSLIYLVNPAVATCITPFPGISCNPNDVKFYLYPNPANLSDYDELVYLDDGSIARSRFNSWKNLIILAHGFTQTFLSKFPTVLKDAYLNNGFARTANVIAVDWGNLSAANAAPLAIPMPASIVTMPQYVAAVNNVKIAGERVAEFLSFLVRKGFSTPEKIHVLGQSLGAHVAGYAGNKYKEYTLKSLNRVTGLDPAGPLFFPRRSLIDPSSAKFVDIVHTDRGGFGYLGNLGHADFNVNGGGPVQPGCGVTPYCAHNTAPIYYAQSIAKRDLMASKVGIIGSWRKVVFGEYADPRTRGLYNIFLRYDEGRSLLKSIFSLK